MRSISLPALVLGLLLAAPGASSAQGALRPLPPVPVPSGNPITPEKALLGKALFWEEQLSSTNTVACGTCHIPSAGGSDPRSFELSSANPGADGVFGTVDDVRASPGVVRSAADGTFVSDAQFGLRPQNTGRKSPTMINAAYAPQLFWDGRSESVFHDPVSGAVVLTENAALESQAAGPPVSDVEMAHEGRLWTDIEARLEAVDPLALASDIPAELDAWIGGRDYAALYEEAFGSPGVTAARTAMAIATYQRTLISNETKFDRMLEGDFTGWTGPEVRGLQLFLGKAQCTACHQLPFLTDFRFHNIGVRPAGEDIGRANETGLAKDRGRFKTPDLRNATLRAPFFHNGSQFSLAGVVGFYDRGGDHTDNLSPLMGELFLSGRERIALQAFLEGTLTDPRVANELPPFDRPTLFSESSRRPRLTGFGTPGTGGEIPRMVALEPGLWGSPSVTFGIENANGGSLAFLGYDVDVLTTPLTVRDASIFLPFTPSFGTFAVGALAGVGAGEGWGSVSTVLPPDPGLGAIDVGYQWVVLDPGATGGIAASAPAVVPLF